jgi:hypothetical protein
MKLNFFYIKVSFRFKLFTSLISYFVIFLAFLSNCTSQQSVDLNSIAKDVGSPQKSTFFKQSPTVVNSEALIFRSLFYQSVKDTIPMTQYMRLNLYPDEILYNAPQLSFETINKHFQSIKPEKLLLKSFQNPPLKRSVTFPPKIPPPTLIVIPGAFSEFAYGTIFSEAVDNKQSSFSIFVRKKFESASLSDKIDSHYLLSELKEVNAPLDDLIRFGSVDNNQGESLINVIFLFPKLGSLESLWTVEEHYPYYKRRLDKFFNIIGNLPRIYMSGHSRGGAIGLDFIARTDKDPLAKKWTRNIKGFIGFNAALMGIHFADAWFNERMRTNIIRKEVLKIKSLEDKNEIFTSIINREKIFSSLQAIGVELAFGGSNPYEPTQLNWPDITAGISFIKQIEAQLKPESVFGNYQLFIKRLKIGAEAIDECLRSLSHKVRLSWWQQNTLPTEIKYYTFVATMHSPMKKKGSMSRLQQALWESPFYQRYSIDYTLWRKVYIEHFASGESPLLDGPVAAHEGMIWPEWHRSQNKEQNSYTASLLGIFGTHHLGMNYALASSDDHDSRNPFPRRAFLISLAKYLSNVETQQSSAPPPSLQR